MVEQYLIPAEIGIEIRLTDAMMLLKEPFDPPTDLISEDPKSSGV